MFLCVCDERNSAFQLNARIVLFRSRHSNVKEGSRQVDNPLNLTRLDMPLLKYQISRFFGRMNSAAIVVGAVDNYIAVSHDSATTVKPGIVSLSGAYMRLDEAALNIQSESGRFFSDNPINLAVREKSLLNSC